MAIYSIFKDKKIIKVILKPIKVDWDSNMRNLDLSVTLPHSRSWGLHKAWNMGGFAEITANPVVTVSPSNHSQWTPSLPVSVKQWCLWEAQGWMLLIAGLTIKNFAAPL